MANVKVLKTNGTEKEILEKTEGCIHLFISALDNSPEGHDIGDILLNNECNTRYALIVKEMINSKIITASLRLSIIYLLKTLLENDIKIESILISRHQFNSTKEEDTFICTLRELCITYFGEVLTDDINLIITDYEAYND